MRIGEALRLTLQDVDLADRVITVRDTKFFKTRLVPIGPKLTGNSPRISSAAACCRCRMEKRHRYLRRVVVEVGAMHASSPCSSMCAEPPESSARSASCALHAYTIFVTRRPCIGSSLGIAPAKTSSDCSRSSPPTLVTSISDQPSVTSK